VGAGAWVLLSALELDDTGPLPDAALAPLRQLVRVSRDRRADCVLVGRVSAKEGSLDGFMLAAALDDETDETDEPDVPAVGAVCWLGEGRSASVALRELTCVDHLHPGRAALLLAGDTERLAEAAAVARALLHGDPVTAGGALEHVVAAPNLPPPSDGTGRRIALFDTTLGVAHTLGGAALTITRVDELAELTRLEDAELVLVGSLPT
jgi:hypothetical protein